MQATNATPGCWPMPRAELMSTSDLAIWFGYSRAHVIQVLKGAGLEPVKRGARGVSMWERTTALGAFQKRHAE